MEACAPYAGCPLCRLPPVQVLVQVGGEFVLQESSVSSPCLFVAGGIGITALLPMIAHLAEQQQLHTQLDQWYDGPCSARSLPRPVLLYSGEQLVAAAQQLQQTWCGQRS
jgi:hypothetical protein